MIARYLSRSFHLLTRASVLLYMIHFCNSDDDVDIFMKHVWNIISCEVNDLFWVINVLKTTQLTIVSYWTRNDRLLCFGFHLRYSWLIQHVKLVIRHVYWHSIQHSRRIDLSDNNQHTNNVCLSNFVETQM